MNTTQLKPYLYKDFEHHMNGKDVAQGYVSFKTKAGEFTLPLLGTVNENEHPITEHGYRPVSICSTPNWNDDIWITCISEEGKEITVSRHHYQLFPEAFVLLSEYELSKIPRLCPA